MKKWTISLILNLVVFLCFPQSYGQEKVLNPGELYDSSMALYDQGRFEEAIQGFSKIVQSAPAGSFIAYSQYMIGLCYLKMEKYEKAIQQLQERGVCDPYVKEYMRTDGTRVTVLITDAMLDDPKEEQILALILDVTESKQAEEKLRQSEERYRLISEAYQRAIESLVRLVQIYPEYKLNKIYMKRGNAYQNRIKSLQISNGLNEKRENSVINEKVERNENNVTNHTNNKENKNRENEKGINEIEEFLLKEKPKVSWGQVVGLDDAKRAMRESIVYPTKRSDLFPLGWPKGILLYGPPRCGKTLLAAAAAAEIEGYFINVDAAAMLSKWLGEAIRAETEFQEF